MRKALLQKLPLFAGRSVLIVNNQSVSDIVKEVVEAHSYFASDYDLIAADFESSTSLQTARNLFNFLKTHVAYKIESDKAQTTKSPSAILETAAGDCKHYAGFAAGVLDALKRAGHKVTWHYRFASYNFMETEPGHVFVVLVYDGTEYWIDPVLESFNQRLEPHYYLDKKVNTMLNRLSGIGYTLQSYGSDISLNELHSLAMQEADPAVSPELLKAISTLYYYGVMDSEGRINDDVLTTLSENMPASEFELIANARITMHNGSSSVGAFFSELWSGVKTVTLAVPRNAYLSLVALNIFGTATKIQSVITTNAGVTIPAAADALSAKWQSLGGSWQALENAINSGRQKKAILGSTQTIGEPITFSTIAATAAAVIAAMKPLLDALQKNKDATEPRPLEFPLPDGPTVPTYNPDAPGTDLPAAPGTTPLQDFIKANPMLVTLGLVGAGYFFYNKKQRA